MPDAPDPAVAAEQFRDDFEAVRRQVARVIVGQEAIVEQVLTCLFVGGHTLLEGVPGIGKTLLVRTIAQAIRLDFGRVQFTPDLMPADITGTTVIDEQEDEQGRMRRTFRFQPGPVFNQIVLADEINRATPKTQSALLEAMQERSVTVGNETHKLPRPFFVLATQNPIEQEGTYPLPEAQLDRFFFKVLVGSPTRGDLREIIARTTGAAESAAEPALDAERLLAHQALVRRVPAADHVVDYAVRMVLATHPKGSIGGKGAESFSTPMVDKYAQVGASPRAAQSLILAAKCYALTQGRPSASIEDIQRAALPALRHRVLLNFEAGAELVDSDAVVKNLIETLPRDAG
ncbi:MAG: AAA family ATPase [Phycisphaerales bacterium]|nr:AAA family ATPase [Planctomycetota bacterium]MCH8509157.1 AAA family ATPase [Phycisphaerales bacterium]